MWRGRYFSSTHVPFCAQELASFGGRSIKNALGRIGYDRVSVNSRGEMRVSPPFFRLLGSARGRNFANASC